MTSGVRVRGSCLDTAMRPDQLPPSNIRQVPLTASNSQQQAAAAAARTLLVVVGVSGDGSSRIPTAFLTASTSENHSSLTRWTSLS
jgi:hypothetical protein